MKLKKNHSLLLFTVICLFHGPSENLQAIERTPTISLDLKDMPLANVLDDMSQQIQYQIILDKDCGNPIISGKHESVPVEKALAKLLKRQNISILLDYDKRIIHLDCVGPGENNMVYQGIGQLTQNTVESRTDQEDLQTSRSVEELNLLELSRLDPMPDPLPTSKTPQELDEMVDPETGLTLREMEKQMKINFN